jgi:hypothetical protein
VHVHGPLILRTPQPDWLLDAGYQLVYLVAQGIILAVWP